MANPDVCIAGAGIIGLSLARSLARAGMRVLVLTRGAPMADTSQAAAGMLAVDDPDNPPELHALARLSRSLYPRFLEEISEDFGQRVAFQTHRTLQILSPQALPRTALPTSMARPRWLPQLVCREGEHVVELEEQSVDPRELAAALVQASAAAKITVRAHTAVLGVRDTGAGVLVETSGGRIAAASFVDCTGAWSLSSVIDPSVRVAPRKGQMLTVATPPALARQALVVRSHEVYLVPRLHGPRAGQCVIGATIEDAGFNCAVHAIDLRGLLERAARMLPELGAATIVESWAGVRPATADQLPVLGRVHPPGEPAAGGNLHIASGHYRNGILLAPATASVMTELLLGREPAVSLAPFSATRFEPAPSGAA